MLHCKVRVDCDIDDIHVPRNVQTRFEPEQGNAGRRLPDAELEKDESGIWATFWVPSDLNIDDNNQVEVTAEMVAVADPDEKGPWTIQELRVRRLW